MGSANVGSLSYLWDHKNCHLLHLDGGQESHFRYRYRSKIAWREARFSFSLSDKKTRVKGQRLPTTRFVLQMSGDRQCTHDPSVVPVGHAREQRDIGLIMHLHVSEQQ